MGRAHSKKLKDQERKRVYTYQKYRTFDASRVECDTIRGIIKDNCTRDQVTGEIGFETKNLGSIHQALQGSSYQIEKEYPPSDLCKHLGGHVEKESYPINISLADKIVGGLLEGEILNRAIEPCNWR